MKYSAPEFDKKAFHCPICSTYSHMNWLQLHNGSQKINYYQAYCSCCTLASLWKRTGFVDADGQRDFRSELIDPDNGYVGAPEEDMPVDVKKDYMEAAKIFSRSPRGAAALLRLGLQKLCMHLGQDGKNIDTDIRKLAAENVLPPLVVKVADTVRITGNNAVHPGEMSDEDFDHVASKMFDLLNFIVKKLYLSLRS